jgi:hypothetical protein
MDPETVKNQVMAKFPPILKSGGKQQWVASVVKDWQALVCVAAGLEVSEMPTMKKGTPGDLEDDNCHAQILLKVHSWIERLAEESPEFLPISDDKADINNLDGVVAVLKRVDSTRKEQKTGESWWRQYTTCRREIIALQSEWSKMWANGIPSGKNEVDQINEFLESWRNDGVEDKKTTKKYPKSWLPFLWFGKPALSGACHRSFAQMQTSVGSNVVAEDDPGMSRKQQRAAKVKSGYSSPVSKKPKTDPVSSVIDLAKLEELEQSFLDTVSKAVVEESSFTVAQCAMNVAKEMMQESRTEGDDDEFKFWRKEYRERAKDFYEISKGILADRSTSLKPSSNQTEQ